MEKSKKQLIEEKFHDQWAASVNLPEINIYENFSLGAQENRRALQIFEDLKGKKILDLGCGFGETAVYFAIKGAEVEGVDISSESIKIGNKLAKRYRVSKRCNFQQMAAEKLKFKKEQFDYVFGNGVLHHVVLGPSLKEINRVLKKGGLAFFIEPISYNPIINVYRKIADEVRTPTERPLTFKDIEKMKKVFREVEHFEYQFFTLIIFLWFFLIGKVSPNQARYWKKILKVKGNLKQFLRFLIKLDNKALKYFPPLRYLCWNTTILLKK